jgi:hypothetical protein
MIEFKGLQFSADFKVKSEKNFAQAQNYIDSEVIKRLEDYTPVAMKRFPNRGKMSKSHVVQSPGIIINTEPTARKEYYLNKGFSGRLRGKCWLDRMKADQGADILKGVQGNE